MVAEEEEEEEAGFQLDDVVSRRCGTGTSQSSEVARRGGECFPNARERKWIDCVE